MGLRGKLNQRPSGKTRVSTRLKYAIAGGVLAAALILVIYYVNKEEVRKNRLVNINEFKWQKAISINHQYVEGDIPLINFPLLVNLFESDLRHKD